MLRHDIADRATGLVLACCLSPRRIPDEHRRTGYLPQQLAARAPGAVELVPIDPRARDDRGCPNDGR
jgi:hypothetical protein